MSALSRPYCDQSAAFGPASACRSFDFSVVFENTILSILPNSIFLLIWCAGRFPHIARKKERLDRRSDWLLWCRTAVPAISLIFNAALLAEQQNRLGPDTRYYSALNGPTFTAALSLTLVTNLVAVFAIYFERIYVIGGNFLIPTWLLMTALFDGARLRTFVLLGLPSSSLPFFTLFAVTLALKVVSLGLDTYNSSGIASPQSQPVVTHEASAPFVNRLGFVWLAPLLMQGNRGELDLKTLQPLQKQFDSVLVKEKLVSAWQPSQSLLWACLKAFPVSLLMKPAIPRLFITAAQLGLPFVISDTIAFITSYTNRSAESPPQQVAIGWSLAGAYGLIFFVIASGTGQYFFAVAQAATKIRGALVTMMFEKCPGLHLAKAKEIGSSGAVNLLGTDVEKIILCIDPFHELWSGILTICIGSYILWLNIGISFLAPVLFTVIGLVAVPIISRNIGSHQKGWSTVTDSRLKMTGSIFAAIKAIKMMAWESVALQHLVEMRKKEIEAMRKFYSSIALVVSLTNVTSDMLILVTFVTFGLVVYTSKDPSTKASFNSQTVFTALATLNLISTPLLMIGQRFSSLLTALASLQRIEDYLRLEEIERKKVVGPSQADNSDNAGQDMDIRVDSLSVKWSEDAPMVLRNVSVSFPHGQLSTVSGPVSCGKSTFLYSLLGEVSLVSGSITSQSLRNEKEAIPYANQSCWVQESQTIRENILFYEPFDQEWYSMCLYSTALDADLATFSQGDQRMAKGLSGGQRQRVCLARAIYRSRLASTLLLDDSFSALDVKTERHIIRSLFDGNNGLLKGKTVILVTTNTHISASSACHLELNLDGSVQEVILRDSKVQAKVLNEEELEDNDVDFIEEKQVQQSKRQQRDATLQLQKATLKEALEQPLDEVEDVAQSTLSSKTYMLWAKLAGYVPLFITLSLCTANIAATTGSQVILEKWAQANQEHFGHHFAEYIAIFIIVVVASVILFTAFFYCWVLWVVPRGSQAIHQLEAKAVLAAPMSFFHSNPIGRILNRFSQDLFYVDLEWPIQATNLFFNLLTLIASLSLMVASAPFLLIIIAVSILLSVTLRRFYMPSSRQLRRVEMAAKSPLYSTCTDLIDGIAVFRAYKKQVDILKHSQRIVDQSQRPYYYLYSVRTWLQTWINVVTLIITLSLVLICVGLRNTSLVTLIGVSLSRTTQLSLEINQTLVAWTEAEITAVAIERITEFIDTPPEQQEQEQNEKASPPMPQDKSLLLLSSSSSSPPIALQLRDYSGWYSSSSLGMEDQEEEQSAPCLNHINLDIEQGSYIGVCGRTGSGKSTLLLAIARMLPRTGGRILLHGQDISSLTLKEVRSKFIVIPQDPFILGGATVRQNLDFASTCSDDAILWSSLEQSFLKGKITDLDKNIEDYLLSPGQMSLFAIARALVISKTEKQAKFLLLDEINSNFDHNLDNKVQSLIQTSFKHLTILSVVHRLSHISDFTKVLVLSQGRVDEYGSPKKLLQDSSSSLYKLIQARNAELHKDDE